MPRRPSSSARVCCPEAVQREHELPEQPLAERMLADEALDFTYEFPGQPAAEVGLDPLLDQCQTLFFGGPRPLGRERSNTTSASAGPRQSASAARK